MRNEDSEPALQREQGHQEALYVPDSPLRRPRRLLRDMYRDLLASRDLAWRLMVRNLKAQYRQSLLGFLWAIIPPVVTAAVFTLAKGADMVRIGHTELPYPAYVMISMSLWQTFVEALGAPLQAWSQAKPMLTRINLPREAILLAKLGEILFGFTIKLLLIVTVFVVYDIPVTPMAFAAPFALFNLVLLGLALGTLLASVGGLYQDVSKGIPFLSLVWLMLTPVVYPAPEDGKLALLVGFNPVTPLLVTTRDLATTGRVSDPTGFAWSVAFTVLCSAFGWLVFRIGAPFIIERMSS